MGREGGVNGSNFMPDVILVDVTYFTLARITKGLT